MSYLICKYGKSGGGLKTSLDITCDEDFVGETITFTNGTSTLTATVDSTLTVEFDIPEPGTWILSNSLTSETDTYNITDTVYTKTLLSVPDGKTVLPVNDVEIWQKCAGITPVYDTLAEVLHDSSLTIYLMANDNAVDYMVRSKTWATTQALIPVMTSDTTPEGTVISKTSSNSYQVFDGNDSTIYNIGNANIDMTGEYLGYTYSNGEKKCVNKIRFLDTFTSTGTDSAGFRTIRTDCNYKFQGQKDDDSWEDIGTFTDATSTEQFFTFDTTTNYKAHRCICQSSGGSAYYTRSTAEKWLKVNEIQFYSASITDNSNAMAAIGASDYAANTLLADSTWCEAICNSNYFESVLTTKVPIMTSNTTPSGESFSGSALSVNLAYKAFNNDTSTEWVSNYTSAFSTHQTDTIGYKFDNAVSIKKLYFHDYNPNYDFNMTYIFSGSNDGVTYTDLYTENTAKSVKNGLTQIINNSANYTYYRLTVTMWASSSNTGYHPRFDTLQFYGRQPSGVQTWLHKAGITDKNYTTLAEVLNDTTTLTTLMNSTDAVDYLVTVPSWAKSVSLVPTMTSNTTPEGEVVSYGTRTESGSPYYAFDGVTTNVWIGNTADCYVGYHFTEPKVVNHFSLVYNQYNWPSVTFTIDGSNDGINWDELSSHTFTNSSSSIVYNTFESDIDNTTKYSYYRIHSPNSIFTSGSVFCRVCELQFYSLGIADSESAMTIVGNSNYAANTLLSNSDWVDAIGNSTYFESVLNVKVPTMTSNTIPSGEVWFDSQPSPNGWHFFDGNVSQHSGWSQNSYPHVIGYDFERPVKIVGIKWYAYSGYSGKTIPIAVKYSDNKTTFGTWDTITATQSLSWSAMATHVMEGAHRYWAMYFATQGTANSIAFGELQFYGREDI